MTQQPTGWIQRICHAKTARLFYSSVFYGPTLLMKTKLGMLQSIRLAHSFMPFNSVKSFTYSALKHNN